MEMRKLWGRIEAMGGGGKGKSLGEVKKSVWLDGCTAHLLHEFIHARSLADKNAMNDAVDLDRHNKVGVRDGLERRMYQSFVEVENKCNLLCPGSTPGHSKSAANQSVPLMCEKILLTKT